MAHELTIGKDGKAEMFFTGDSPWHGLGQKLDNPATAEEAITASNLGWKVEKTPIFHMINGKTIPIESHKAIIREDNNKILGVVTKQYVPLQNTDAFKFFDEIVGKGEAVYHTAGSLKEGERIWILAKLPNTMKIKGNDIVDKYLLLSNGHNGKNSVQVTFTPIRVVCSNTLSAAFGSRRKQREEMENGNLVQIMHKGDVITKLNNVSQILGIIKNRYELLETTYQNMANKQIGSDILNTYIENVFPKPELKKYRDDQSYEKALNKHKDMKIQIVSLFEKGRGNDLPEIKGTLWAGYNAIVEYVDYKKIVNREVDTNRQLKNLNNIWFSQGMQTKEFALQEAEKILVSN